MVPNAKRMPHFLDRLGNGDHAVGGRVLGEGLIAGLDRQGLAIRLHGD